MSKLPEQNDPQFWDLLAIQAYQYILRKAPKNALMHHNLGLAYLRTERSNKAIRSFLRAVKYDKDCLDAYYHLGKTYQDLNQPKMAMRYYKSYRRILEEQLSSRKLPEVKKPSVVEDLMKKLAEDLAL